MAVCAACWGRVAAIGILWILRVTLEALSAERVSWCIRTNGAISVVEAPIGTIGGLMAAATLSRTRNTVWGVSVWIAAVLRRTIGTALAAGAVELPPLHANGLVAAIKICYDAVLARIIWGAEFATRVASTMGILGTFGAAATVIAIDTKWGRAFAGRRITTPAIEADTLISSNSTGVVCVTGLAVF